MRIMGYLTDEEEPRWTRWLLLLFIPLGALYLIGAEGNSETFNTSVDAMYSNDQKVYLRQAQELRLSDYQLVTPRHRTPGYPYLLSVFFDEDLVPEADSKTPVTLEWFTRARAVNTGLSVVLLAGLYFFFRRTLPRIESGLLTASLGSLLYVFRAGYTQPELLYWSLNLVLFYLLMRMLLAPSWKLAAASGVLAAIAFMVKAATQPLILLFVVSFAIKLIWDYVRNKTPRREMLKASGKGALVPVLFLLCLSPYLINSTKIYGEPFYSIYSKYLMWLVPEVEVGDKVYVDKHKMWALQNAGAGERLITLDEWRAELRELKEKLGEPYVEPEAFPSAGRYFEQQSLGEILERPQQGLRSNRKRMDKYYPQAWTLLKLALIVAAIAVVANWRWAWTGLKERGYIAFFVFGFFIGYLFLYGWYDALRIGPRLILSLYPVALFVAVLLIAKATEGVKIPIRGKQILLGRAVNVAGLVLVTVLATKVFTDQLYLHFSGG